MTTSVSFRLPAPPDVAWTAEAAESLVGKEADLSLLGEQVGRVFVTAAETYEDDLLGPGLWITVEPIR